MLDLENGKIKTAKNKDDICLPFYLFNYFMPGKKLKDAATITVTLPCIGISV
jgi:hypothetical protein